MEVSPFNINTSSEGNMDGVSGVVFGKDWREERKGENNILEIIQEVSSKIEKKRPFCYHFSVLAMSQVWDFRSLTVPKKTGT